MFKRLLAKGTPTQRTSRLKPRPLQLRVYYVILAAVVWALFFAQLAIITPLLFYWQNSELVRLEDETLSLLKANVDITTFPTVEQTVKMGNRLRTFSVVRGGAIYNAIGEEIGVFGSLPTLTYMTVRREKISTYRTPDKLYYDVFFPVERTGLANALILRLDASNVTSAIIEQVKVTALKVLAVAFISALAVVIIIAIWVVQPVLRVRDAAMAATDNPDKADAFRLRWTRSDEIGEAARALDLLLTAVSIVYQEDLAANQEAMQRSSFATMIYDPNGRMNAANPSAMSLFGVAQIDDLMDLPAQFIRIKTTDGPMDLSVAELLARGDFSQLATILTPKGQRRCHINAVTIRKKNGAILRQVVTMIDLSKQASYMEYLEAEIARLQGDVGAGKRRSTEMRGLFESCLVLMSAIDLKVPETAQVDDTTPVVSTERLINAWYAEAGKSGLVTGRLEHGVLPPVKGEPEDVEAIIRQAMLGVYSRSQYETPVLKVDTRPLENGMVEFIISEKPPRADSTARHGSHQAAAGIQIAMAGLMHSLARAGGHLTQGSDMGSENAITFALHEGQQAPALNDAVKYAAGARG